MADDAARSAQSDSTAALLTSAAGYNLLPGEDQFEHPILDALSKHGLSLIEERPLHVDVGNL
jgi:hypothetical protein